jgi:hypothetical protein
VLPRRRVEQERQVERRRVRRAVLHREGHEQAVVALRLCQSGQAERDESRTCEAVVKAHDPMAGSGGNAATGRRSSSHERLCTPAVERALPEVMERGMHMSKKLLTNSTG